MTLLADDTWVWTALYSSAGIFVEDGGLDVEQGDSELMEGVLVGILVVEADSE